MTDCPTSHLGYYPCQIVKRTNKSTFREPSGNWCGRRWFRKFWLFSPFNHPKLLVITENVFAFSKRILPTRIFMRFLWLSQFPIIYLNEADIKASCKPMKVLVAKTKPLPELKLWSGPDFKFALRTVLRPKFLIKLYTSHSDVSIQNLMLKFRPKLVCLDL